MRLSVLRGLSAVVGATAVSALAMPAAATVLTFDMGVTSGTTVIQSYGDRVPVAPPGPFTYGADGGPTPNVTVDYGPTLFFSNEPLQHFGDLRGVLVRKSDNTGNIMEITFTADTGYEVCLMYFSLAAQINYLFNPPQQEDLPIKSIRIETGNGTALWSLVYNAFNPPPGSIIDGTLPETHNFYDFTGLNLKAQQIRIRIDLNQILNKVDKIGIDNIGFCQMQIPSPGPSALLAGSLFAAGLRRRRR